MCPRLSRSDRRRAVLGRAFSDEDFRPGGEHVIMIGNTLWREHFGASPSVLGKTIRVSAATSGETPTNIASSASCRPASATSVTMAAIRPTRPCPSRPRGRPTWCDCARACRTAIAARGSPKPCGASRRRFPQAGRASDWNPFTSTTFATCVPFWSASLLPLRLVLLIVVTNIVVLMLLRALRRQKETAVRVALGPSRIGSPACCFAEAALVCGSALVAGVAVTTMTLRALGPQIEARLGAPVPGGVSALAMDGTVLLWIGGIGLADRRDRRMASDDRRAPRATRRQPARRGPQQHRSSGCAPRSHGPDRAGSRCLNGAADRRRAHAPQRREPCRHESGLRNQSRVSSAPPAPLLHLQRPTASFARFYDRLEEQLAAIPNLSFALSTFVPFWEPPKLPVETDRHHSESRASLTAVGPDYFRTLGIGLREGRAFTRVDRTGAEPVAVISESLARTVASHGSALGTRIRTTEWSETGETVRVWRTVVGVAHDVHQTHADVDLNDAYIPFAQTTTRFASVYIRANGSSQQWLETLRTVVASIDPDVFVGRAPPLAVQADDSLAGPRFVTALLAVFALFAALLALLGIYAVTAYAAQQREREIAIRIAIGATAGTVIRMFVRDSGTVLLIGLAGGVFGGAVVSRILQSQLHGVERFDPWTFAMTCVFLGIAGLFATWLPTRRVAQSDPATALRAE